MNRFRKYIELFISGKTIRGISVSPSDIYECVYVYNSVVRGEKPEFINGRVKEILDICGIKTVSHGIGWKIA